MKVVADSGSTKCDWIFYDDQSTTEISTMGFNPMFHTSHFIAYELRKNRSFMDLAAKTNEVFYYGAGCQNEKLHGIVRNGLAEIFGQADIMVEHDLHGAVYAACLGERGIACILGTGSNSAYFDGKNIHEQVPALGYILGDEGSGAYFGKNLLAMYFYKQLPKHLLEAFTKYYPSLTKSVVFEEVYMEEHANVYLASFMRFLSDNKEDAFVQDFVYRGFSDFIDIHIWRYKEHKEVPIHFVGSVASHFEELLRKAAAAHRLKMGRIIQRPVESLLTYHRQG